MRFFAFLLIFLQVIIFSVLSQKSEMYRLILTDKGDTPFSIDNPIEFLSQKAIDRRTQQGLVIEESDLPIDPQFFHILEAMGVQVRTYSKWAKTIVVNMADTELKDEIAELPFVREMVKVWEGDLSLWNKEDNLNERSLFPVLNPMDELLLLDRTFLYREDYGKGLTQIELNNGLSLHQLGYMGNGKTIAVIDGGFENVDKLGDFFNLHQILGVKNFSHNIGHPFRLNESHGTMVLSCMLSTKTGELIGTAPDACFYLFNTEIGKEEYPVEEDYWIAAVEYADSIGVDIITSSLGYSTFDDSLMNHTWEELDGSSISASKVASMIAGKGIVLFVSAGNLGNLEWQKVSAPGDAENILTVGALKRDSALASFSSWGYLADNRIKPDVMGMGLGVSALSSFNGVVSINGTSFSTPILAGLGACLWQSLPHLTSFELMDLIKLSSDRYLNPDKSFGYGIPDIYKAYQIGNSASLYQSEVFNPKQDVFYIDYLNSQLHIRPGCIDYIRPHIFVYTADGRLIMEQSMEKSVIDLDFLKKGIYIITIQTKDVQYIRKFIKQ